MANEWLLYGTVGVALILGAVWLAWRYYYDRINRSLSAAGWVGWDSAHASGLLRRRLRTHPELFVDRTADHPPTTPEEAAATLHLLPWAEHTGNGFGDDGKVDRATWVVIQPLLRGPPGCVQKEEYEDFLRLSSRGGGSHTPVGPPPPNSPYTDTECIRYWRTSGGSASRPGTT